MRLATFLITLLMTTAASAQSGAPQHSHGTPHTHDASPAHNAAKSAVRGKQVVQATEISPEYIQMAKNVEIIPNIENAVKSSAGVLTHEGLFGPLLFAEQNRAFFIELKPGMFLGEHPHDTGSIVYTVRGNWVLASEGKRQVMKAGSLFRFGDGMPTGWEAPFAEAALLLIVKPKQANDGYGPFHKGIKSMQATVDKQRKGGSPFYYNELKPDHPAITFARSVNPKFDDVLAIKY